MRLRDLGPLDPIFDVRKNTGAVEVGNSFVPTLIVRGSVSSALMNRSTHLVKDGDYCYVLAENADRLVVVDVSDLDAPTIVGSVTHANMDAPFFLLKDGDVIYVTAQNSAAVVSIDVSDPFNPTVLHALVDAVNISGPHRLVRSGTNMFVTAGNTDRLTTINISNPSAMTVAGSVTGTELDEATQIIVRGSYAYIHGFNGPRFAVVDISTPTTPVIVGGINNAALRGADMLLDGNYIYIPNQGVASAIGGLQIIDISTPSAPNIVGSLNPGTVLDSGWCAKSGDVVFIATSNNDSVVSVDVSNPSAPFVIDIVTHSSKLDGCAVAMLYGDYLMVSTPNGSNRQFTAVRVSNPNSLAIAASCTLPLTAPYRFIREGNIFYGTSLLGSTTSGLWIVEANF